MLFSDPTAAKPFDWLSVAPRPPRGALKVLAPRETSLLLQMISVDRHSSSLTCPSSVIFFRSWAADVGRGFPVLKWWVAATRPRCCVFFLPYREEITLLQFRKRPELKRDFHFAVLSFKVPGHGSISWPHRQRCRHGPDGSVKRHRKLWKDLNATSEPVEKRREKNTAMTKVEEEENGPPEFPISWLAVSNGRPRGHCWVLLVTTKPPPPPALLNLCDSEKTFGGRCETDFEANAFAGAARHRPERASGRPTGRPAGCWKRKENLQVGTPRWQKDEKRSAASQIVDGWELGKKAALRTGKRGGFLHRN